MNVTFTLPLKKISFNLITKLLYPFFLLVLTIQVQAQNIGIGTNTPDASAKLHIEDPNRGLLIPRISIPNLNAAAPVTTPATSLLVYNTNPTSGEGFHYWDGIQWVKLVDGIDHDWYEVGTTTAPDDITDNIYTLGNVGIRTNTPTEDLHLEGNQLTTGYLDFGSSTRQMINLWGTGANALYGIGVQNNTQYYRSPTNFAWFLNGTHSNNEFDPGTGGTMLASLTDAGGLRILNAENTTAEVRLGAAWDRPGLYVNSAANMNLFTAINQNIVFGNNNTELMRFTNTGRLGIGTNTPSEKLHLQNGSIRIVDGTEGVDRVLVSDANGVGSWQSLAGSWAAYGINATSNSSTTIVTFGSSTINGTGGSVNNTNGRIFVPAAGLYRVILYFDFQVGTTAPTCQDILITGFDAGGATIFFNCDDVGQKNVGRTNGYMQAIFNIPTGGFVQVQTGNFAVEGMVSVERVN